MLGLMDVTVRIPSLPDEYEDRRVRTSVSEVNGMGYGISDTLGKLDHLAMIDLVVPNFRSKEDECLFGMFGLAVPLTIAGKVPKYVQDRITGTLQRKLEAMDQVDTVSDALRRTFLTVNRDCFDQLMLEDQRRKNSSASSTAYTQNPTAYNAFNQSYRGGASAAVMYMKGKTVHIANTGRILAVVSCGGEAELLSETHDPFEREETLRIRASEGWVSHRGLVNDDIPISRGFGFYHAVPAVNSLPYVSTRQLTDADEFIIIANRALWDYCSYQTAVDIARGVKDDPMKAAQKLRDLAISYGSEGSIMVMVISVHDLFRQKTSRSNPFARRADGAGDGDGGGIYSGTKRNRRKAEDIGDRTLLRLEKEVQPPTGQVALVFTDIKNSTSLWETNPGMQTAMRMHNSLLRRQLRIIGGYEVKTEGDAFMVSFPTVTSALLWTFTCQLQLMNEDWPREILESEDGREIRDSYGELISRGLSVRMGIHVGVPVWEKDPVTRRMDYFGPMVNKSSRVSASAEGGFIFISADAMKEVEGLTKYLENEEEANEAADTLGGDTGRDVVQLRKLGVGVLEMGERKLKGLEGAALNPQ
jgi:adenylate cyclase